MRRMRNKEGHFNFESKILINVCAISLLGSDKLERKIFWPHIFLEHDLIGTTVQDNCQLYILVICAKYKLFLMFPLIHIAEKYRIVCSLIIGRH